MKSHQGAITPNDDVNALHPLPVVDPKYLEVIRTVTKIEARTLIAKMQINRFLPSAISPEEKAKLLAGITINNVMDVAKYFKERNESNEKEPQQDQTTNSKTPEPEAQNRDADDLA